MRRPEALGAKFFQETEKTALVNKFADNAIEGYYLRGWFSPYGVCGGGGVNSTYVECIYTISISMQNPYLINLYSTEFHRGIPDMATVGKSSTQVVSNIFCVFGWIHVLTEGSEWGYFDINIICIVIFMWIRL